MRYLIKNGTVVDGTGKMPLEADVLISGNKIERIGNLKETGNFKVINAEGMIVCPGFIDVNNHSDTYWTLFTYPGGESLITQGITTIIGGACGSSLAPLINDEAVRSIQKYVDISRAQVHWASFQEFLDFLDKGKFNPNFGSLVGHSTIRRAIIGNEVRDPTADELQTMLGLLDNALEEGALGLSTGLVYSHARIASREEIVKLAEVVKKHDGVYATHIRQEGDDLISSIKEALEVAEKTGVKLQISHLKACGEKNWPLQMHALEMIKEIREKGFDVNFDVYPYTEAGPVLYTLLPDWVSEGGKTALLTRLKNPKTREKVLAEMKRSGFDWGKITIAVSKISQSLVRRKISEIAKNQERSPEEVVVDLILASDDKVTTIIELMSEKNVELAIVNAASMVSTNGAGYSLDYKEQGNLIHPRCFGALPKFIKKYVYDNRTLPIEEAISKITRIPAEKFGLIKKVGTLERGKLADIVVFNPQKIADKATVDNPFRYSEGVRELFIGGELAIENFKITGKKLGSVFEK